MVNLMAEAAGNQLLALGLVPVAVPILGTHLGIVGALHQAVFAGDAEATLCPLLLAVGFQQLRVYQLQNLLAGIHNHHSAQNAHLGGS